MNDKDRLQVCWQAFSMENALLQSYRMLFVMVEAALLALAYFIRDISVVVSVIGLKVPVIWVLVGFGWAVVGMWVRACEAKGKDADRWRDRILELKQIIARDWFDYLKPAVPKRWVLHPTLWSKSLRALLSGGRIARFIFNYVIPISIGVLWGFMVFGKGAILTV